MNIFKIKIMSGLEAVILIHKFPSIVPTSVEDIPSIGEYRYLLLFCSFRTLNNFENSVQQLLLY